MDAKLSFNVGASIAKARQTIADYRPRGVKRADQARVDVGALGSTYEHEVGVDSIEGRPRSPDALDGDGYVEEPVANADPNIPLDMRGTAYEKRAWAMLPGEATNYGAIAPGSGARTPERVTDAVASNAIAILVPCHRVIEKDGALSGYRLGGWRKRALLNREGADCGSAWRLAAQPSPPRDGDVRVSAMTRSSE